MNNTLLIINLILVAILLVMGANQLYLHFMGKKSASLLTEEEFREGMRRAQVIDVREKDAFASGHILGARSIPYTTFKATHGSLRKDMPIYLYDHKRTLAVRAAIILRKNGFTDVNILQTGYKQWTGKIKIGN